MWVDTPHTTNRWLEMAVVLQVLGQFVWFHVFALIVELEIEKPVCLGGEVGRTSRLAKREGQPRRGTWGERGEGPGPVGGRMGVPRM